MICWCNFISCNKCTNLGASQVALVVKYLLANAEDVRDMGSIPGSGRSPGGGHGYSLQYSCLEDSMNRGAWWATVHRVSKSQTLQQWQQTGRYQSVQFSSVAQSCLTHCDPMNHSMPGLPVHHQLPESTQTNVHWVGDAIQPSHPLSSPSPPALNLSQHQVRFKWISSSHQVAKVLGFQLQHQSLQWIPGTDLL